MTIFLLFFGISALDAIATRNWWRVAFWSFIALAFLGMSILGRRPRRNATSAGDTR